jgi:aspartyl-tRNA(Asn)/glutamyl-tRNA(Gln) amidotransferase subunit A
MLVMALTIVEAGRLLRARTVSSAELVEESLSRIAELNPRLNAFITVMEDSARRAAGLADAELARGFDRGPLHGIPVAVKDVFATRGVRTTAGSKLFADYVSDYDAAAVERLAQAGALLVGKTGMHELAYGITSNNPHFGPVRNPHDPERIPGGSSGGSGAAVASGMVPAALGTDTGGSIRIPAAMCGVVGLKPTYGRVSRYGVLPLDETMDHVGPLAATVRDAAIVLNAIAGHDPRDPASSRRRVEDFVPPEGGSLKGVRLGLPRNFYFDRVTQEARAAVERTAQRAEQLGARLIAVRVPDIEAINAAGRAMLLREAAAIFKPHLENRDSFGADVLALLDQGLLVTKAEYTAALRVRSQKRREFRAVWTKVDLLLTPTTPFAAPKIGQTTVEIDGVAEDVRLAATRLVRAANVLGFPALSIPCGRDAAGLPLGVQLMAPAFREAALLACSAAL